MKRSWLARAFPATAVRRAIEQGDVELLQLALPGFVQQAKEDSARNVPLFWLTKQTLKMDAGVATQMIHLMLAQGLSPNAHEHNPAGPARTPLSYAFSVACDRTPVPAYDKSVRFADIIGGREMYGAAIPTVFYQPAVVDALIAAGADPKLATLVNVYGDLRGWKADNLNTLSDVFDEIEAETAKHARLEGKSKVSRRQLPAEAPVAKPTLFVSQYGPRRPKAPGA